MDEKKDEKPDLRFVGLEIVVGCTWALAKVDGDAVVFTFSHPRHGALNFRMENAAAKLFGQQLAQSLSLTKQ